MSKEGNKNEHAKLEYIIVLYQIIQDITHHVALDNVARMGLVHDIGILVSLIVELDT